MDKKYFHTHWVGMPECDQKDLTSHRKIIIHFRNDDDVKDFEAIINQKFTPKQKSTWYPPMPVRRYSHLEYREVPDE